MPSILVADDNTNIQKMVALAFEDRGITVVAVGNGEAAVRRMPDMNPDLVLADIFMPVRNGYEVCEFVKKDQRFAHVPVILLVGAFDPLDEKEARRVGADGVLKKPFVPPDPLIAMVISALEKNPRVVAEWAKAKAALEAPALPDAAASFEVQTVLKAEPKPLPDFPEPTAEEAALVYGFGKGVRAIDNDEPVDAAKEPPAPVAARGEEDDDEDLGTGATASDWRRTAMDFEISAEDANRPAFSRVDELESSSFFPSEADGRKAEHRVESPVAAALETTHYVMPVVAQEVDLRALEPVEAMPVEHAPISFSREPAVAPPVSIEPPVVAREPVAEPEPESEPEPEPEAKPSLATRMRHWMDGLVSSPSPEKTHEETKGNRDWVAALSEPRDAEVAAIEQRPLSPEPPQTVALAVVKPAAENFFAGESMFHGRANHESAPPEVASTATASSEVAATEGDPIETASAVVESGDVAEAADGDVALLETDPPEVEPSEFSEEAEPEPTPEIWERVEETTSSLRDPDLVVPPAVRVTPEPLLVDEEPEATSNYGDYGESEEEVSAAHTFEVAVSPELAAEDTPTEEASLPEPSLESGAESAVEHGDERVPTGPPPNRHALAEIPFLNPPEDFDPDVPAAPQSPAVDASTVDAVVQKLLERLQPQLHDLLSQGVLKPLVENLLQQEASKKEK